MIGRPSRRQGVGRPIEARTINDNGRTAADLSKIRTGPGLLLSWLGGIPTLLLDGVLGVELARSPSGGVAARSGTTVSSGSFTLYTFDGVDQLAVGSTAVRAFNPYAAAVPGLTLCLLFRFLGVRWAIGWEC